MQGKEKKLCKLRKTTYSVHQQLLAESCLLLLKAIDYVEASESRQKLKSKARLEEGKGLTKVV